VVTDTVDIAVIGVGPRGLSVVERLCANAGSLLPEGKSLVIHLIDPHVVGGGLVWRNSQDGLLLMNTVASQVTMFVDATVDCEGPVISGPSLYEWARAVALIGSSELSAAALAEAAALGPDDYPSRSFYGCYLEWTLRRIRQTASDRVSFTQHPARAVDVRDVEGGRQQVRLDDGGSVEGLHAVVLALGHLPHELLDTEAALEKFAAARGLTYIGPSNPADVQLEHLRAGEPVILRGMGLNFFDYLALLTVGRGGCFEPGADGRLVYRPSGREPRLITGSRRGVPYHGRARNEKGPFGRHEPRYLTHEVIARFRARADRGTPADFRADLWPLIDHEVRTVYYTALQREQGHPGRSEEFADAFGPAGPADVPLTGDPLAARETDLQAALLDAYGIAAEWRFDWRWIARPYPASALASTADFRRWLREYVARDVVEADKGNLTGPLKAALDVLRDLRNEIRLLVDHGGLSGDAYRDDLQRWYMPLNAFVSIGPPLERIEQFGALMDAEVLEVLGPDLRVDCVDGRFVASSGACPDLSLSATALVEARLPEADLHRTTDVLLRSLLARGECRSYRIPISGGGWYVTGGVAVTRRPNHLIDAADRPHPRRFAFGVPTEGVHWVTAAGIRPGVNSVILGDSDAIARSCLKLAEPSASLDAGRPLALAGQGNSCLGVCGGSE
jgi:hypothetical protein